MRDLINDLRSGLRTLGSNPTSAAVVCLTLALGIGAATAMFSVVHGVLLRPLPFERPFELVRLFEIDLDQPGSRRGVSPPSFVDWRRENEVFEDIAAISRGDFVYAGGDEPTRLQGALVSASFFSLLRSEAVLGRTFLAEEDRPEAERVVVLSHRVWQERFAADPEILGRAIEVEDLPCVVVGVLPTGFDFPADTDVWMPIAHELSTMLDVRGARILEVVGRLGPGIDLPLAQARMDTLVERLAQETGEGEGYGVAVVSLHELAAGDARPALLALSGAVGFVLLISATNGANLLLARASTRSREMALRAALGARRFRLVRQLLVESLMLACVAGMLGLLLSLWGVDLVVALGASDLPRAEGISINASVLLFAAMISLLTGVVFGLVPALHAARPDLAASLRAGTTGLTRGDDGTRMRQLLVVAEVAMSLILLVGAGLMVNSFVRLLAVDPGFEGEGVLTMEVALPTSKYPEPWQRAGFFDELLERVRALPAVAVAGATTNYPLSGTNMRMGFREGAPTGGGEPQFLQADYRAISPDYFRSMGIPLVRGRDFARGDRSEAPPVVIVNEELAQRYWPGEDPLGKRLRISYGDQELREVIGVAGNVRHGSLASAARPEVYVPFTQHAWRFMRFTVRTSGDPAAVAASLREQVWAIDSEQPVGPIRGMEEALSDAVARPRFIMSLFAAFGIVAALLAAAGVYGVVARIVTRRTQEIGVRVALGASSADVLGQVLGRGMILVLVGIGLGWIGALAASRAVAGLLYEVGAADPATYLAVSLMLVAVGAFAIYVPARRAARVDPMVALRSE